MPKKSDFPRCQPSSSRNYENKEIQIRKKSKINKIVTNIKKWFSDPIPIGVTILVLSGLIDRFFTNFVFTSI
jgi:hypothetical protein